MDSALFDYTLPKQMIAQYPAGERSSSRLLIFNRSARTIEHGLFLNIAGYLHEGDVLVLNNSKVFPARLKARKATGGIIDILLVQRICDRKWYCLTKGVNKGTAELMVDLGGIGARLSRSEGFWVIQFLCNGDDYGVIRQLGRMPLPPYIKRKGRDGIDFDRYQTVYAEAEGSIAAPTAGFHFTKDMLESLQHKGVSIVKITLHIGIGTFFLIKKAHVDEHSMHKEYYQLSHDVKEYLQSAKRDGRRIIACGTSVVRALETAYSANGATPLSGYTELFIYPGYRFRMVDAMITNFHLPKSTPLLLVSAFAGREALLKCYGEAMEKGYRFYSYGDAMLVL